MDKINNKKSISKQNNKSLDNFKDQVSGMSYEESLKQLDQLLNNLQDDNFPISELKLSYIKGNILLERCQMLLSTLEQEVSKLDVENLN
tara:strand:+ start:209 stop:475 length:267 start_codon:yes stop_codon:yes gene_type:complete